MLSVKRLKQRFDYLELLTKDVDLNKEITVSDFSRPGLELTGYIDYFPYLRIQVLGSNEASYLELIKYDEQIIDNFLDKRIPAIIFCRDIKPTDYFVKLANERNIPVFTTKMPTSKFLTKLYEYLEFELAPQTQIHGVLVSVFGKGVLIKGVSGIGKSEVALELINRGHFLVADDAVVIKRVDDEALLATAPELLKNRIEIRGVGIIDVQKLYGVTKVIKEKTVDLVVDLQPMTGSEDRIGNATASDTILGISIPKITIPMTVGRSACNLIEVAVANHSLKYEHGYDSSSEFINDLNESLIRKNNE